MVRTPLVPHVWGQRALSVLFGPVELPSRETCTPPSPPAGVRVVGGSVLTLHGASVVVAAHEKPYRFAARLAAPRVRRREALRDRFGGVVLALSLAFGLAGRDLARQLLERLARKSEPPHEDPLQHL